METTDRRLWMRRALVTAAAVATLPFLSLPEVPSTQLPPVFDLFNRAWAPLALAALLSFVAFSLVLIWSRAERGARDLAVFLAGAALTLSVWMSLAVDNPDALEEMLESLSAPVSVTFAVWTLSCAALMRFSVTFPRQATLDDFHRAFWFGNKPLVETPPTFTRWVWWLFENAWPVGMGVSAFLGFASTATPGTRSRAPPAPSPSPAPPSPSPLLR